MTDRELNLDELLGPEAVRHYLGFITPGPGNIYGDERYGFTSTIRNDPGQLAWNDVTENDGVYQWAPTHFGGQDIECRGMGAQTCSSSFELASRSDSFIWDVCEYYRLLGVPVDATRKQLRRAFYRRGGARGSKPRLTYALKQLLNPFIRQAYDEAVPTQPFFLDKDTQENLKRKAIQEAARQSYETGTEITEDEVLARWGIKRNAPGEEEPLENLVPGKAADKTGDKPVRERTPPPQSGGGIGKYGPESTALGSTISPWQLQWAWYVWYGRWTDQNWDPKPLEEWQRLIRHELGMRGLSMNFAVGLHAGSGWKIFQTSEGTCIVFLARSEYPHESLAAQAVEYIAAHQTLSRRPPAHASKKR